MSSKKILVVNDRCGEYGSYYQPFSHLGECTNNARRLDYEPDSILCAVFTGGADVSPENYRQKASRLTHCTPERDKDEIKTMLTCIRHGIPVFGICRGAQLMTVVAGGTLCQHLTDHGGCFHGVKTSDGNVVMVNSLHHQMMIPPHDANVLAWCDPSRSQFYIGENDRKIDVEKEVEVVHFPKINGLAVQYHPEMLDENHEGALYYQDLISDFLFLPEMLKSA